jgi:hypothetical protein
MSIQPQIGCTPNIDSRKGISYIWACMLHLLFLEPVLCREPIYWLDY